jgi:hypothetical protein
MSTSFVFGLCLNRKDRTRRKGQRENENEKKQNNRLEEWEEQWGAMTAVGKQEQGYPERQQQGIKSE